MPLEIQDIVFVHQLRNAEDIRWHTRHHSHPDRQYELHYFIGGQGRFRVGGNLHSVHPGDLFLCPPRRPHAVDTRKSDDPVSYYAVLFRLGHGETELELEDILSRSTTRGPINIGRNHRFFFEELKERSRSTSLSRRHSAIHQLISFLYLLGDGDIPAGEPGNVHLGRTLDLMQDRVYGRLRLPEVSVKLGITESYIIRLFRMKLNTTPMKYYTRLKVEAAASLLADTSLAVYEIADRLCFYSEHHFSRVFKHYTGTAPSLYRREQYHRREPAGEKIHDDSRD